MAMISKISIIWDVTRSILIKLYRRFGGTYSLRIQGRRESQGRIKQQAELCFLLSLLFNRENGGSKLLRNVTKPSSRPASSK
jgi:hypothetical protein